MFIVLILHGILDLLSLRLHTGGGSHVRPDEGEDFVSVSDALKVAGAGIKGGHGGIEIEIIQSISVGLPGVGGPGESKAGKRPKSSSQTNKSDARTKVRDPTKKKKGKSEREEEDSLFT